MGLLPICSQPCSQSSCGKSCTWRDVRVRVAYSAGEAKGLRAELLDRTLIWNETHRRHTLREYERHYNLHRTHRSLAAAAPLRALPVALEPDGIERLNVHRQDRLGGIIVDSGTSRGCLPTGFGTSVLFGHQRGGHAVRQVMMGDLRVQQIQRKDETAVLDDRLARGPAGPVGTVRRPGPARDPQAHPRTAKSPEPGDSRPVSIQVRSTRCRSQA